MHLAFVAAQRHLTPSFRYLMVILCHDRALRYFPPDRDECEGEAWEGKAYPETRSACGSRPASTSSRRSCSRPSDLGAQIPPGYPPPPSRPSSWTAPAAPETRDAAESTSGERKRPSARPPAAPPGGHVTDGGTVPLRKWRHTFKVSRYWHFSSCFLNLPLPQCGCCVWIGPYLFLGPGRHLADT